MQGIAATRVDVVAHSMGGLITRKIVASGNDLVHKLITLDTPHAGSLLADWLIVNEHNFLATAVLLPFKHAIHRGAVDDLRVNTTAGQSARAFSTGRLRGHSIIGIA